MEDTLLSSSMTISRYRELEARKDRELIAEFIQGRFSERYVKPLLAGKKHGFCTMSICCLMVEALESFYQGWPDTRKRSREVFISFFRRCAEQESELGVFADHADDFYEGIRCGILHQAETTRGWRIRRKGPLFDASTKIINASLFHNRLKEILLFYRDSLKKSDWDSEIWHNLRRKMDAVIENCKLG
jgi:hypothetical protein